MNDGAIYSGFLCRTHAQTCAPVSLLYDHFDCRLFFPNVVVKLSFLTVDLESCVRGVVGFKFRETSSMSGTSICLSVGYTFSITPLAILSSRPERPIVDI